MMKRVGLLVVGSWVSACASIEARTHEPSARPPTHERRAAPATTPPADVPALASSATLAAPLTRQPPTAPQAQPAPVQSTPKAQPAPEARLAEPSGAANALDLLPIGPNRRHEFRNEREAQKRIIDENPDVGDFAEVDGPFSYVPDKVSIDQLVRALPCPDHREDFRQALHRDSDSGFELRTAWLHPDLSDDERKWQVLWARTLFCNVVFLFDASGALRDKFASESRGTFSLVEAILQQGEQPTSELLFEELLGTSLCCYPVVWRVIRVTPWGKFKEVFHHDRSHDQVGPGVLHDDWYRFEFADNQISVKRVLPSAEQRPTELYTYHPSSDRYVPSPQTRELMAEEVKASRERADQPDR